MAAVQKSAATISPQLAERPRYAHNSATSIAVALIAAGPRPCRGGWTEHPPRSESRRRTARLWPARTAARQGSVLAPWREQEVDA